MNQLHKDILSTRAPRILFAAGGTGGHVYPAIAIADAIRTLSPETVIEFAGTKDRMEWQAVPKAGYSIHPISAAGLQRQMTLKSQAKNVLFPYRIFRGYLESRRLVKAFDPDVVVGTGGYVSGPVLRAASDLDRPIVIQEQNAYAGMTNKWLAPRARRVHIAFDAVRGVFPDGKCVLSGNPTRQELVNPNKEEARTHFGVPENATVLFVFGGSLGSVVLNRAVRENLSRLLEIENVFLIWQTGKIHFKGEQEKNPTNDRVKMLAYVDRMDLAYAVADLVICRAGAISCSEVMVTGKATILIPSPHVAEDHQTKNALAMSAEGAAVLLHESDTEAKFGDIVAGLLSDADQRAQMSENAKRLAKPEAALEIASSILELAGVAIRKEAS